MEFFFLVAADHENCWDGGRDSESASLPQAPKEIPTMEMRVRSVAMFRTARGTFLDVRLLLLVAVGGVITHNPLEGL